MSTTKTKDDMLENAFIRLQDQLQQETCGFAMPIKFGGNPIYFNTINEVGGSTSVLYLLDKNGTELTHKTITHDTTTYPRINIAGEFTEQQVSNLLQDGECFFVKVAPGNVKNDNGAFYVNESTAYQDREGGINTDFYLYYGRQYAGRNVNVQITITIDNEHRHLDSMYVYYKNTLYGWSEDGVNIIASFNAQIDEYGRIPLTWKWAIPYQYLQYMGLVSNIYSAIITMTEEVAFYSNTLKFVKSAEELSYISYKCNDDEFGFPFEESGEQSVLLPIILKNPQFKTKDEVYTKLNGENVILYSTITKEYNMETEYITEEMHNKIVTALSCDNVRINGESLYKSGEYSIDWENKTEMECGEKIAKAACKMQCNYNSRNSN